MAADPKGDLSVFEGNRRYTSGDRADNIAGVDTDCAETKTVSNRINRCKGTVCYQSLYEVAEFLHPSGEDPFSMQGKEAVKKSLPELEETDLNWMYDTMMRTMFYKGCDIRDGEQMYRLYGQCRKKVKQGLNAWKRLQWNVIKCFP